jgi:hypothetical protein
MTRPGSEGGTVRTWPSNPASTSPASRGATAVPAWNTRRRFDLHRTDLIDHSCGSHLA